MLDEEYEWIFVEEVLKLRGDKGPYDKLRRNMEKAKEFCWEQERLKLEAEVRGMMRNERNYSL